MEWSLYSLDKRKKKTNYTLLRPLVFSNGKTQANIVEEVYEKLRGGKRIVFIKGMCGTGKSAIALNLAKLFNKTSIVVPIKSLQTQYEEDYTQKKVILKDGRPLKISIIKGRNNFDCAYDISKKADHSSLPCLVEIKEKNKELLYHYLNENPYTDPSDFEEISDIRRINIAAACPYWSPLMPSSKTCWGLGSCKKKKYMSISEIEFALFHRKKGCGYYDQFESYSDSDVLIFNSAKYLLENEIGRKPKTDLEIIDECDEFLDSFSNERRINLTRLTRAVYDLILKDSTDSRTLKKLYNLLNDHLTTTSLHFSLEKLEKTPFKEIVKLILKEPSLAEDEELNYYNTVVEIVKSFESVLSDTYVSFELKEKSSKKTSLFKNEEKRKILYVTLVSINLKQRFKQLLDYNDSFVMMSGTLHSPKVLKDLFGIEDFEIVEAETSFPGPIFPEFTGLEKNCSYESFKNGSITREQYLKILDYVVGKAPAPALIHVNAFADLPSNDEIERLNLVNLPSVEDFLIEQDNFLESINDFYTGKKPRLFTTKCSRGIDFPGDKCKSIVITRFPYPNIEGLFWKILRKENLANFMSFYIDKAKRDLIQKLARGVRFKGDSVKVFSPDIRVLEEIRKKNNLIFA